MAGWARLGQPVIIRRRATDDAPGSIPAALPLPPSHGKRRIAFSFRSDAGLAAIPPVHLCDATGAVPADWRPVVAALLELGASLGTSPRIFGALLWQHVTGLAYLSTGSDLDLLWQVPDGRAATALIDGLSRIEAGGPVRLDGELELADGAGVNWRELLAARHDPQRRVLAKTMDALELRAGSPILDDGAMAS